MGSVAKAQESVDLAVGAIGMYAVNGQSPKGPTGIVLLIYCKATLYIFYYV
jgi:hypothetical protein